MSLSILLYVPINGTSPDIESLVEAFIVEDYQVHILNQSKGGGFNERMQALGAKVAIYRLTSRLSLLFYVLHALKLIFYCRKHDIDIVYSHLEPCNTAAVMASYFMKSKVAIVRHHVNAIQLFNANKSSLVHQFTYHFAPLVIAISERAREYMILKEGIHPDKIELIKLGINFSFYRVPNPSKVQEIKQQYKADVLLLSVGRLVASKRHAVNIALVKKLIEAGLNVKLMILGRGPEEEMLREQIIYLGLQEHIAIVGFVDNVQDYMKTADFLVHPSILDSSSLTMKEAGLVHLPVIVCKGVGDFEDMIEHEYNGFLVDKDNPLPAMADIIITYSKDKSKVQTIGSNLYHTVIENFSVEKVMPSYRKFHQKLFSTEQSETVTQKSFSSSIS